MSTAEQNQGAGGAGVEIVYAEFGRDRTPLAWRDGSLLDDDRRREREALHRRLSEIVSGATRERWLDTGRAVRAPGILLTEVRVDNGTGPDRVDTTVVLSVPPGVPRWDEAAERVAKILTEAGVTTDPARLAEAFAQGWRHTGPLAGRLRRSVVGAGLFGLCVIGWRTVRRRRARHRIQPS